jgi:hypothetical protein
MSQHLSRYLYVFNYVVSNGVKRQRKYYFGDISAWYEIDGYTCYIGFKDLTMSMFFHSKFSFDYRNEATLKAFDLLINNIFSEL